MTDVTEIAASWNCAERQVPGPGDVPHRRLRGGRAPSTTAAGDRWQCLGWAPRGARNHHVGFEPQTTTYLLVNEGLALAWDWQHVGLDVGGDVWLSGEDGVLLPRFELRAGLLERIWLETGTGQLDGSFDWRLLYFGGRVRHERLSLGLGMAAVGSPIVDLRPDHGGEMVLVGPPDAHLFAPYGSVGVDVHDGVTLQLAGAASTNYNARLLLEIPLGESAVQAGP